jgi:hypothetical protein
MQPIRPLLDRGEEDHFICHINGQANFKLKIYLAHDKEVNIFSTGKKFTQPAGTRLKLWYSTDCVQH